MIRRFDRRARALSVLASAVSATLVHAQTLPTTLPATTAATAPATQPVAVPTPLPTTQPVTVVVPSRPDGKTPATRPATKISLEFKDATVDSVLDYLSEAAGFIVVKETPVEGRVSIISRRPVTGEEALTLLNAALKPNGYTAIQQGRVLKVVLREKAKKQNIPVHFGIDPNEVAETDELITQVIPVKTVDAAKLRQDLQPLVSSDADYTANQGSNSLIITDTSSNIKRIVAIVAKLDQHEQLASDIYIKQLTFANAAAAAKLITTIFGEGNANDADGRGGRGGGSSRFFRAMLMGGGGPPGMGGPGGAGAQDGGKPGTKVTASADDRTNTLVVVAPLDTIKLIEKLLKVLDSDPASASDIKVFQLSFADAAAAAKLINNIFQPEPASPGDGGRGGPAGGGRLPALENLSPADRNVKVNAAAADHTNTLVVTAPPDTMKLIAKILQTLDSDPAAMSEVKVFQLKYADSSSAAKLIASVFQTDSQSQQQQQQQEGAKGRLPSLGGLNSSLHGGHVNASSDDRTNTLVVTAPPDAMKIITSILAQLDSNPSAESSLFIYHLRNGVAADIQATMSSLFGSGTTGTSNAGNRSAGQSLLSSGLGGSSGFGSGLGGGSSRSGLGGSSFGSSSSRTGSSSFGAPLTSTNRVGGSTAGGAAGGANIRATSELVGQVIVVADTDTNSLLVSTANRYKEQVMKIIEELDRPVPQVLIKVLVAEVTHDKTNDVGIDFSVLDTRATGKGITVGSGLGNGAAAAAPTAGLVVSLMENNLNGTLHALATEGKLDVLSRPYILASDNQQASITVGQEVPFITNTQITDTGQQINTIQYQAVGIILNVTPHINPDGAVTLDVAPEISAISATSVPIGNNITAPVIDNRSAQSRVTIKAGNTIVIGGLMQDQKTTNVSKIPLLGDIPYIGAIFSRTQDSRTKTELLIFLTPHLAQQPEALKPMSAEEMKGTRETPHAVDPGTFEQHMKGMQLGDTPFNGTTRPAVQDFKPAPSTQPFTGITISEPGPKPPGTGIEK